MEATAAELKAKGNELFVSGEMLKAAGAFTKALKACKDGGDEEAAILCNRCAALLKLTKLPKVKCKMLTQQKYQRAI